jgi:hypothetical protein
MADEPSIVVMFLAFIAAIGVMILVSWVSEPPRLRRLRFGLRSFLIFMAFAAVVIALVAAYSRIVLTNTNGTTAQREWWAVKCVRRWCAAWLPSRVAVRVVECPLVRRKNSLFPGMGRHVE